MDDENRRRILGIMSDNGRLPFVAIISTIGINELYEVTVEDFTEHFCVIRSLRANNMEYREMIPWHQIEFLRVKRRT